MDYKRIDSPSNQRIKDLCRLKDGKGETFLVEGFHMAEEALKAKAALEVYALKPYKCDVPLTLVSESVLKKLASSVTPEGIVVLCQKKKAEKPSSGRVLVLDEVRDPGNVGTLLRTALCFGYRDVVLMSGTASAYSYKTLSASQGSIFHLNVIDGVKKEALKEILDGYFVIATDLKGEAMEENLISKEKIALILGNEARGVSRELLDLSDFRCRISMEGLDSLNVAVAGGIAMHAYRHMEK